MTTFDDVIGWLAVGGVIVGVAVHRRRNNASPSEPAVPSESSPVGELTAGDSTPTAPKPAAPEPAALMRRPIDAIHVRCEYLDHLAAPAPTITITAANVAQDLVTARRWGWGSTNTLNPCRFHNPAGLSIDVIHVQCTTCGERTRIRTNDATTDFGGLRNDGWKSTDDPTNHTLCPYCVGIRRRPRW
jgi:hypothetical protein